MPPTGKAYDVDWIWSFESNVHISTDREWFSSFTAFKSTVANAQTNDKYSVEGIGNVELQNSTIVLRNVLYVPSFVCNVVGNPVREDYDVSIGAERWLCDKNTGKGLGMLDKNPLGMTKVLLKGQAKGQTGLSKDVDYRLSAVWEGEEQQRWKEEQSKK